MKAITVRNLPQRIAREVKRRAKEDSTSLNGAVLRLLEERLGMQVPGASRKTVHRDLDFLCGSWTEQEASEFEKSLASQRIIDTEMWK